MPDPGQQALLVVVLVGVLVPLIRLVIMPMPGLARMIIHAVILPEGLASGALP